ncbi:hypothetical protein [Mycolicibacterium celeriflavum]|uniref:hypothetical protein n=1 Tax=Mycolicibacterium celeriflavum TaxID=1249101 RepID=UPI003CEEDC63
MKRISRFAATAAASGGLALAGLGLASAAGADYYWFNWCPGQTPPSAASNRNLDWDWNVCHQYRYQGNDLIDESGRLYPAPPPPPGAICGRDLFTGTPILCGP